MNETPCSEHTLGWQHILELFTSSSSKRPPCFLHFKYQFDQWKALEPNMWPCGSKKHALSKLAQQVFVCQLSEIKLLRSFISTIVLKITHTIVSSRVPRKYLAQQLKGSVMKLGYLSTVSDTFSGALTVGLDKESCVIFHLQSSKESRVQHGCQFTCCGHLHMWTGPFHVASTFCLHRRPIRGSRVVAAPFLPSNGRCLTVWFERSTRRIIWETKNYGWRCGRGSAFATQC